jgi:hypothetical protein
MVVKLMEKQRAWSKGMIKLLLQHSGIMVAAGEDLDGDATESTAAKKERGRKRKGAINKATDELCD